VVTAASLRAAVAGALAAAALGCGGGGGARPLPTVTAKPLAPSKAPTAIVLYRNGAWVTVRRAIDAPAGRSVVELPLAERLDATEVTLTRVTGATVVSTTVTAPRDRWARLPGGVERGPGQLRRRSHRADRSARAGAAAAGRGGSRRASRSCSMATAGRRRSR
jgi:hypothetical protein